ncbi:MAG: GNAT family protein [Nocardioides sp.]|uniref:GNAT family N-acetyltransferase n=1 Tax=Nocardioides sp. TaxID=35761 RepID=UPI0039E371A4
MASELPVGEVVEGWAPRPGAERIGLEGRHVTLKPLTSAHFADLYDATCGNPGDAERWTYLPAEMPGSRQALWMLLAGTLEVEPATFAVVPHAGPRAGRPAGFLSLMNVVPAHGSMEVGGICLGADLQRTTAATEAIHLLQSYAFDELGYRRFEWKCNALNAPSRRAAERFGFAYEGTFRNHLVVKGRNRDTAWFSITDAEWPAIRRTQEAWLAPENFDADGRQRQSLSSFA